MRTIFTLLLAITALFTTTAADAKVYMENGSARFYDLKNGDTLIINSGEYKGRIQNYETGWVIIVRQHAVFAPTTFSYVNGKVFNYGTTAIEQYFSTNNGFFLENYGTFIITAGTAISGDQPIAINNRATGIMRFGQSVAFNAPVTMVNDGQIVAADNLTLNNGSVLTNNNSITVDGMLTLNTSRIINNKRLNSKKRFTINAGSAFTNNAMMIAESGVTNNGAITNSGLLWISAKDNNDFVNNGSGSITMMPESVIRTGSFTNNSAVNGEGTLYMLNNTVHNGSGSIGSNDAAAGEMIVFDATRTNTTRLFDTQWGSLSSNVVYRQVSEPDTVTYATQKFVVLPIKWHAFTAQLEATAAQLTWKATDNAGVILFAIERSVNGQTYTSIATTNGNTYSDATLPAGATVLYYRIKATSASGEVKYSDVRMIKTKTTALNMNVWPNPAVQNVNVSFNSSTAQPVIITVKNIGGQTIVRKSITAQAGANQVSLTELAAQSNGYYVVELWQANALLSSAKVVKR